MGTSNLVHNTCMGDATRVWNKAPLSITNSISIYQAKKEIKDYVNKQDISSLPKLAPTGVLAYWSWHSCVPAYWSWHSCVPALNVRPIYKHD